MFSESFVSMSGVYSWNYFARIAFGLYWQYERLSRGTMCSEIDYLQGRVQNRAKISFPKKVQTWYTADTLERAVLPQTIYLSSSYNYSVSHSTQRGSIVCRMLYFFSVIYIHNLELLIQSKNIIFSSTKNRYNYTICTATFRVLSDSCTRWRKIYNIRNVIYRFFCRFTCASCLNRKTPFCRFGAIHVLLFLQVGIIFDSLMRGNIAIDWTCARVSVCMQLYIQGILQAYIRVSRSDYAYPVIHTDKLFVDN